MRASYRLEPRPGGTEGMVWLWQCDKCGKVLPEPALTQRSLPSKEEMEDRGWFIAPLYGDMCPTCFGRHQAAQTSELTSPAVGPILDM